MSPHDPITRKPTFFLLSLTALLLTTTLSAAAQDLTPGLTYVCSGEKMFIESCNVRDLSDTATCMVGHPDHIQPNGLMQYTNMTRGALKKLFPTCTQPSAKQTAAAHAFQQKQQDTYNANVQKANQENDAIEARARAMPGSPAPPKNAEERAMRRCVSSGRLPSSCTGNALLGAFSQMLSGVLGSGDDKSTASAGPTMAGVFQGAGNWRLDFIDGGVLVNCSSLSPNQESYSLDLKNSRLTVNTKPRPLILTLRADGTIVGPGPVTINGVVPGGYTPGTATAGHTETSTTSSTQRISASQATAYDASQLTNTGGGTYDATTTHTNSTYVPGTTTTGYTNFVPRQATCPALNLSSKGASVGIQTMQTDLLKGMLGGDKGAPTPPGIRMHGIFAASTGFSAEFYPESVILGCGPDAARAYPYTVAANGAAAVIKIDAPDHPLTLAFRSDGSLDPGSSSSYQVHGRVVTGQDNDDNFTFAPNEQTCNLAVLTPAKAIPASGGIATTAIASATTGTTTGAATAPNLSTSAAPLGNATLSIVSGFPPQPGLPNPLAGHPYTLLRDTLTNIITKGGIAVPAGTSPYKVLGLACGNRTPDCQKILDAVKANAATAVRADANGSGTFPAVTPGTYYLMISTQFNNHALVWDHPVQLKSGPNALTLNQNNATPIN